MRTGGGKAGSGFGMPDDFGSIAQRYWQMLSDTMNANGAGARAQDPWRASLDAWSQWAGGGARGDASDAVERFSAQARQWLGTMQQVAGQFAGRSAGAGDIASAWKEALGQANPFAELMNGLGGRGQSGFDQWYSQVGPMLNGLFGGGTLAGIREEGMSWLQMPAFGPNREHQERLQALATAQMGLQRANDAYAALLLEAGQDAFARFESKLAERSEPGRQLQSARALFDLWIDAAEEAYAEIALSMRFRKVYAELVNAQMRVRAGVQREVESMGALLGIPGRSEVDAAHRRIAELERQVRRLSAGLTASFADRQPPQTARPASAKPRADDVKSGAAKTAAATAAPASKAKPGKKAIKPAKKAAEARPSRASTQTPSKRAARPAIATAIPMPEPLKPMTTGRTAKRKR